MAWAVVSLGGRRSGTVVRGAGIRARRARWLQAWALPPRAPRRRARSRDLLKRMCKKGRPWWSPDTTFMRCGGDHKQAESGLRAQIFTMKRRCPDGEGARMSGLPARISRRVSLRDPGPGAAEIALRYAHVAENLLLQSGWRIEFAFVAYAPEEFQADTVGCVTRERIEQESLDG